MYTAHDKLFRAVSSNNFHDTLKWLKRGAKASRSTNHFGRTSVGSAALSGNLEILQLLVQSCEDPDNEIFQKDENGVDSDIDVDMESTPEGMDHLEWEDEFNSDRRLQNDGTGAGAEGANLYLYYAKTLERTGEILKSSETEECEKPCQDIYKSSRQQDPHSLDLLSMSPLHYAVAYDNYECAEFLLKKGAKANVFNGSGCTPLHLAIQNKKILELLLNSGAQINMKTMHTGETALHMAIRRRAFDSTKLLIKYKANLNEVDYIHQTPLLCAAAANCNEIVEQLIDNGAKMNMQDQAGKTALYFAVMQDNYDLARFLLDHGARRVPAHYLLHECARFNLTKMASLLLEFGDPYSVKNQEGLTPTHMAIIRHNSEVLELLLDARQREIWEKYCNHGSDTELLLAVDHIGHAEIFKKIARILFAKGSATFISKHSTRYIGPCYIPFCHSPLSRAVMLHRFDIAEFLIKEGINANELCRDHITNTLRSNPSPETIRFTKLTILAGFPNSFKPFDTTKDDSPLSIEKQMFDDEIKKFCSSPLKLKEFCRIKIRNTLVAKCISSSKASIQQFAAQIQEHSILAQMIMKFEIPATLVDFLVNFPELNLTPH